MRVKEEMNFSLVCTAVLGALAAMAAVPSVSYADEVSGDEMAVIRHPENYVEIGAINVDRASAKFGEYNGLNKQRGEGIANFGLKGGSAYEGGDGTLRWEASGRDLGTTSREINAAVGSQGSWNIGVGYNELRHNLSDTYQTPYQGNMGGNNFVLPAGTTSKANTNSLGTLQSAFHNVDIGTTRRNTSVNLGVNLGPQWTVKLDYNHLDQSGAKLMSFGSDALSGGSGEKVAILPNPTNYTTDTVDLSLNWTGTKAYLTTSYFGSFFRDGYDRVTWTNFVGGATLATDTMTTPPGNDFHQFNMTGGYQLAARTKLQGGVSYSRNTQNDPFVATGLSLLPTVSSLNGVVVNTHADLKIIDSSIKDLTLAAGVKYDKRDNQTPSNIYRFDAISGSVGNRAYYPNTPLSTEKTQLEVSGDYRVDKNQNLRLAINHDDTRRWCGQYAQLAQFTQLAANGPAGTLGYPAGTNCVVAKGAREDRATLSYRVKASDDLRLNAAYYYDQRKSEFDPLARTAMIGTNGGIVTGNPLGQNGGDFLGFHPYLDENRDQQAIKAGANWQVNDQWSLGASAKYTDDAYDTQYGWKNGHQWSVNLDASYNYRETGVISTYVTQQSRYRKRTDLRGLNLGATASTNGVPAQNTLSYPAYSTNTGTLNDDDFTAGISFKENGLLKGKLELVGDLSYSLGKTYYGTTLNYVALTTGNLTCDSAYFLICGNTPTVKSALTQFKLIGTYKVDKASKLALGYLHQHLQSNDYYYNGLQVGNTPNGLMPTNQQAANYRVNLLMASYIYNF